MNAYPCAALKLSQRVNQQPVALLHFPQWPHGAESRSALDSSHCGNLQIIRGCPDPYTLRIRCIRSRGNHHGTLARGAHVARSIFSRTDHTYVISLEAFRKSSSIDLSAKLNVDGKRVCVEGGSLHQHQRRHLHAAVAE